MDHELISSHKLSPGSPSQGANVEQIGEKNVFVNNNNGGVVNLNINFSQAGSTDSSEMMMAIQAFSKEYYQLLVTCEEDVFTNNVVTILKNRALGQNYVPPEILERCSSLSDDGIAELKTFPAIICQENTDYNGVTDQDQMAVYGFIKRVQKECNNIKVAFHPIAIFNQQKLCDKRNAVYFDLTMDCAVTDLNHSAWSVHKVNLFDAFKEAGLTNMPMPN